METRCKGYNKNVGKRQHKDVREPTIFRLTFAVIFVNPILNSYAQKMEEEA